jgi:hypothetical protein
MSKAFFELTFRTRKISFLSLLCLVVLTLMSGCLSIQNKYGEVCKSRTYLRVPVQEHINSEYSGNPMVRLGIVPLVTPANFAGYGDLQPPLGSQLAWRLHAEMLRLHKVPIVEVTTWTDWPLKREDFFSGNFEALKKARDSGYDLVFVGYLEESTPDEITVLGKIIDVNQAKTLWYGRTFAYSRRKRLEDLKHIFGPDHDHSLSSFDLFPLYGKLVECLAKESLSDQESTEDASLWPSWLSALTS